MYVFWFNLFGYVIVFFFSESPKSDIGEKPQEYTLLKCIWNPCDPKKFPPKKNLHIPRLNDWFQFDYLAQNYHSLYFGGPHGGPLSQVDLQVVMGMGFEFRLDRPVDSVDTGHDNPISMPWNGGFF